MVPLVFSVACLAYVHRDKIIDQYNAAYPSDPAKAAAIDACIAHNKNFNRLDSDDRQACYRKYIPAAAIVLPPSPSPYYSYSPSHLPGNDIRRQEANDGYHPLTVIPSAQAAPLPPAAATTPPPAPAHPVSHHHGAARRIAAPAAPQPR
ncbi:MAG TPA: hypothetical protein VG651_20970 [Stellaceae bacterium]|nr:hypothetical protein [Stellaceae bacterium]